MGVTAEKTIMLKITNTKEFKKAIKRFSKKTDIAVDIVIKRLAFEVFAGVVEKTPVDVGYARGAWNISANKPDLSIPDPPEKNAAKDSYPMPTIDSLPSATRYYITNNLPYIQALEAGHSKQMDKGHMVSRTINDVTANFERLLKDLDK